MTRLLVLAGAWGWGPITTAEMVCRALPKTVEVTALASGIAEEYARSNRDCFGRVVSSLSDVRAFDAVLSVVEPVGPLVGRAAGVPVIAVDNLFWHWDWQRMPLSKLAALADSVRSLEDVEQAVTSAAALAPYGEYALMYAAATEVHWQRVAARPAGAPPWLKGTWVAPYLGRLPDRSPPPHRPVVSLSGGLINPYTTAHQLDIYVALLAEILGPVLPGDCVIAAPAQLHERLRARFHTADIDTFSREEFLRVLASASILYAPAGLSTTFEACALGVPLVTLPDVHDGNHDNYFGLAGIAPVGRAELQHAFPAATLANFGAHHEPITTDEIFEHYSAAVRDEGQGFVPWARSVLARPALARDQMRVLGGVAARGHGERETAAALLRLAVSPAPSSAK
ncbi:hypothetical protein AB0F44_25780 [Nocardioides sp. NPDC023903]|uniref:hypothetical protein n=1 Tax=Nocardioides sp. NPDC023903 TaxID=3157195 RepID=UPI0033D664F3